MILEYNEYSELSEFLDKKGKLGQNAKRAWEIYRDNEEKEKYVVIKVNDRYCISKIKYDKYDFLPIEVQEIVQPFDENKVYLLQRIKKKIDWVY